MPSPWRPRRDDTTGLAEGERARLSPATTRTHRVFCEVSSFAASGSDSPAGT
ncbi:hypothetical protein ACWEOE_39900 [Amycolatopsis sp. NPDC004368]